MGSIFYCSADCFFKLKQQKRNTAWINAVARKEGQAIDSVTYIFCSDHFLLELNRRYLRHTAFTDVLTFDLSETALEIKGEIYISIDRVKENSEIFAQSFSDELRRVMIHGILHLLGYGDKNQRERTIMRRKEEAYLSL